MTRLREGRGLSAAVLAALALAVSLSLSSSLPSPDAVAAMTPEAADTALLGQSRHRVLAAWGEPDGMLSGFFGDIYTLDSGGQVTVYYDTEPMNQGTADSQTIPVTHITHSES